MGKEEFFDEQIIDMMNKAEQKKESSKVNQSETVEERNIYTGVRIFGKWIYFERIHNGKTMLTFLDTRKDYKLYDEQNRVVTTKKGDELYTHYDKVESSVRERYEKVQKEQKKTTKKKTVTTRKER